MLYEVITGERVLGRLIQDHQVGTHTEDQLDARLESVAKTGHIESLNGPIAPGRAPDNLSTRASYNFV